MKILSPDGIPMFDLSAWMSVALIILTAHGLSLMVWPGWTDSRPWRDRALLGLCLGLALIMAVSPWAGTFAPTVFAKFTKMAMGALFLLLNAYWIVRELRGRASSNDEGRRNPAWPVRHFWVAPCVAWLLLLAPAFCPPMNYDVLEYHMGVVPHWFRENANRPIPHVFYTAQPLATETLYWAAARAEGTPWGYAPGITQWLLTGLTLALLARVLRAVRCPAIWLAALVLLFLTHPVVFPLALDRMTDMTGAMFMLAGLLAIFSTERDGTSPMRELAIGLFMGAAVASKWTNAGTSALMLLLAAMGDVWTRPCSISRRVRGVAMIAFGALLVLGPWLLWNHAHTGNPFAPFLASGFPTKAWGAGQFEFLMRQHQSLSPTEPHYWLSLYRRLASLRLGPPILLGALLMTLVARVRPRRVSPYLGMTLGIVLACLLWGRLGHAATRFLTPVFAASIVIFGAVAGRAWPAISRRAKVFTTAVLALILLAYASMRPGFRDLPAYWSVALGRTPPREMLDATQYFWNAVNALPKNARPIAIGEARTFYFTRPVTVASVFDVHPIRGMVESAQSPDEIAASLVGHGYTHLVVNEYELARLLQFHPALELMDDPKFQELRAQGRSAWPQLLAAFPGWAEFASEPLTPDQRARYVEFLRGMKTQSEWVEPRGGALTFWIAPLTPPASSP